MDSPVARRRAEGKDADSATAKRPSKLSYNEQRELNELPARIEALEAELDALQIRIASADFYSGPADEVQASLARLDKLPGELESTVERWAALEEQQLRYQTRG